ncbi:Ribosomal protein L4/L1e [Blastocystis hominis]|uniref:Ribosomal protein L4/L1e n=1 Tax=Blastocystis hominis TaxID=12968 RepID=D8LWL6_BLAHO|nr:uncharacterized protein [Blastocystis hominis]XP_012896997.1 uncharacterized protein [Blastocystis hominis]XP_012899197.1 Ribosomal protein L4/L1e [Blastocystis hominis]CBK20205.2 unnamed protein product [Blastocystis hominis]CBK22949.2 unnamed protein product [Blastocystis hominis]CBK25149.2 Ribosomal protein L4/L1e [Blastocystis hominis]|eukprot:XP_012894253.1 uncharacterized protein [Blastocystis hominis]
MVGGAARPVVSVYSVETANKIVSTVPLPSVFTAPIRTDVVQFVHTNLNKNHRQPYAVFKRAGHQHSAISWGTGRAVARVPRVSGGGTARSGQGAFANMCRKGRMFAPTKIWRKWHRKVNVNQKRYALVSALAASAVPALVMARGHKIDGVSEIPFVVDDALCKLTKTKEAVSFLQKNGCYADVERVSESKKIRCGKGKMRNRRYTMRVGPMVVYADGEEAVALPFRNIPGVELCNVNRMNVLRMAPGGHVGRFVIWTKAAFERLEALYGPESEKVGYTMPKNVLTVADMGRLINSAEIQAVVRPAKKVVAYPKKANALKNKAVMDSLNPYAAIARAAEQKAMEENIKHKAENLEKKRAEKAKYAEKKAAYYESMMM